MLKFGWLVVLECSVFCSLFGFWLCSLLLGVFE